jgi:tetratricopeptide (TPR) repeat protein
MDANLRQQQVDWRVWQRFSGTETMLLPVFEPEEATWDLGLCLPYVWYRSVETVLGVEQSFLAFFKPVVLAGIIGAVCSVLFGLHAMCPLKFEGLRAGLAWGAISAAVFLAVPLVPRAVGEYLLIRAEQAVLRGELKNAAACFRAAERWKPSLRTSWQHDQCLGHIAKAEGAVDLPVTLLADAYDALGAGQTELAVARLHRVMTLAPDYPGARRFYGRALSVAGLHAFRTGQYGLAKEYWGESLRYLPTDPISWYGLSLVSFRSRRFEDAARYGEQIVRLQQFLGRKRLTVASQAFTAKSWAAFQQGDETTAHAMYSLSLTPENW